MTKSAPLKTNQFDVTNVKSEYEERLRREEEKCPKTVVGKTAVATTGFTLIALGIGGVITGFSSDGLMGPALIPASFALIDEGSKSIKRALAPESYCKATATSKTKEAFLKGLGLELSLADRTKGFFGFSDAVDKIEENKKALKNFKEQLSGQAPSDQLNITPYKKESEQASSQPVSTDIPTAPHKKEQAPAVSIPDANSSDVPSAASKTPSHSIPSFAIETPFRSASSRAAMSKTISTTKTPSPSPKPTSYQQLINLMTNFINLFSGGASR